MLKADYRHSMEDIIARRSATIEVIRAFLSYTPFCPQIWKSRKATLKSRVQVEVWNLESGIPNLKRCYQTSASQINHKFGFGVFFFFFAVFPKFRKFGTRLKRPSVARWSATRDYKKRIQTKYTLSLTACLKTAAVDVARTPAAQECCCSCDVSARCVR